MGCLAATRPEPTPSQGRGRVGLLERQRSAAKISENQRRTGFSRSHQRINAFGQIDDLAVGATLARLIDEPRSEPAAGCDPDIGCPAPNPGIQPLADIGDLAAGLDETAIHVLSSPLHPGCPDRSAVPASRGINCHLHLNSSIDPTCRGSMLT